MIIALIFLRIMLRAVKDLAVIATKIILAPIRLIVWLIVGVLTIIARCIVAVMGAIVSKKEV